MNQKKFLSFFLFLIFCFPAFTAVNARTMSETTRAEKPSKEKAKGHLWEYKRSFTDLYSVADDIKIGTQVMNEQIKEFNRTGVGVDSAKDQALKTRIEGIVQKLAAVSDIPKLPYEVHVFDRPDIVNAFCMPGGKIGVFTGLFDKEKGLIDINSDDQIAAVLGHEIAHATLRHVTRRISKLQGLSFLGTVASVAIGTGAGVNFQNVFDQIFTLGVNLYFPSYSRKFEKNADQTGYYYMSKAGYNPQAAINIWKKAAARGGPNAKKTQFFASHPSDASRAKALERWLPDALLVRSGQAPVRQAPPKKSSQK